VAHGIGPLVKQMQAASVQPVLDGVLADSQVKELCPSHHPVLALRQPRDRLIPGITTASPRATVR
jgi:hypothetical protein